MNWLRGTVFAGAVIAPLVCFGACFGSIPPGGHAAGAIGGGGSGGVGTGGNPDAGDGGRSDAGDGGGENCESPDAGCLGLGQPCDLAFSNGGCATGLVCQVPSAVGILYCEMSSVTTTCDGGECLGLGANCTPANPDNGGCQSGLRCLAQTTSTGLIYTCQE